MPMPCNEIKVCQNIFFQNITTFTIEDKYCFKNLAKRQLVQCKLTLKKFKSNNFDSSIHNFTNRDGKWFSVDCFAVTKKVSKRKWQTQRENKG